ncbi:MAG: FtsW/RodA/SpoVE family cell cycle protein [Candidatus Pacebacteria bacterium]|nr:FtsW/RodA/SpoVE family cell cycle protein [Candidatus Paceibacterota bacterium]
MKKLDYVLLFTSLFLLGFGILILSGVSAVYSFQKFNITNYYLNRQLIAIVIGLIMAFFIYKIPFSFLKKIAFPLFIFSFFLIFLTIIPNIGTQIGGARRWINLGFISFQPIELLKLTFILYLSIWLTSKKEKVLIPFLIILSFISLILYIQKDFSSCFIIISTALVIYFITRKSFLENIIVWAIIGLVFFTFLLSGFRIDRFLSHQGITNDPIGIGFQSLQAKITIGSGGFWGKGIGSSSQKLYLPHSMSDSIFAIIAEEGGFFFSFLIILLFFIFFYRSIFLAKKNGNKTYQLIIIGISTWFLTQALIHIGAMSGLIPITGIPLPLISYGGSHIMVELMALGLVFGILKSSKK